MNLPKTILTRALLALWFFAPTLRAEEESVMTALSWTALTGYVDANVTWWFGGSVVVVSGPEVSYEPRSNELGTVAPSPEPIPDPVAVLPGPVNDAFAAAMSVAPGRISLPSDLASATLEQGEPSMPEQTGSVWFRWDINKTGLARISHKELVPYPDPIAQSHTPALSDESIFYPWGGISYDGSNGENDGGAGVITVNPQHPPGDFYRQFNFAVYRGASLQSLTLVNRGWDVEFQAFTGETLWIAVETFENGGLTIGDLPQAMWVDLTAAPVNDAFESALTVSETSAGYFAGHLVGASQEEGEPVLAAPFSGGSVWFGITASVHGPIALTSSSGLPIAVFSGTDLPNLKLVAKGIGSVSFIGEPAKRYHIAAYAALPAFSISYTAPKYRLYTTTVNELMPAGLQPHFYGLRGSTMLLYAKTATGWDCVEIEPIVNYSTDLLVRPSNAVDGQLRVITIDETLPSPRVQLRPARGWLVPEVIGYPGQTCAVSYSTDLVNWSTPQVYTLTSAPVSLAGISAAAPTHFFRVTQSLPQPPPSQISIGVQTQSAIETQLEGSYGARMELGNRSRDIPPPPMPRF